MTKYYRFVSKGELDELPRTGMVHHPEGEPLYFLSERPSAFIVPVETNYNLTVEQLLTSDFPRQADFTKEAFMSFMTGTVSEYALLELDFEREPPMSNLGWYYCDDNHELCIIEYCRPEYTLNELTAVYTENFYSWRDIQRLEPDQLRSIRDEPTTS